MRLKSSVEGRSDEGGDNAENGVEAESDPSSDRGSAELTNGSGEESVEGGDEEDELEEDDHEPALVRDGAEEVKLQIDSARSMQGVRAFLTAAGSFDGLSPAMRLFPLGDFFAGRLREYGVGAGDLRETDGPAIALDDGGGARPKTVLAGLERRRLSFRRCSLSDTTLISGHSEVVPSFELLWGGAVDGVAEIVG